MNVATPGEDEQKRRQRMRSLAIGLALGALVILFYAATIVRLGPNALRKDGVPRVLPAPVQGGPAAVRSDAAEPACRKAGTC